MRSGRKNPHEERARLLGRAQEFFTRAAACLIDQHDRDKVAEGMVWAGLGIQKIARADASGEVRERFLYFLGLMKAQLTPRVPGPYSGT